MRLLYVLPEFPPDYGGGISTVYGRLLPALAHLGHSLTVLLASKSHLDSQDYTWRGVDVKPLRGKYLELVSTGQLQRALCQNVFLDHFLPVAWGAWLQAHDLDGFDVVEVTDWALLFIPWLVQARKHPVVVGLHGSCGQTDWHGNSRSGSVDGHLVRLLETSLLHLADAVISNSTINADFWWHQCGLRSELVPPAFHISELSTPVTRRSERGVVVGRMQNWKGPEVLCEALRLLPSQHVDWIGQDTHWQECSTYTSAHLRKAFPDVFEQRLHWLESMPVPKVQARISSAAYLCVPSLWDVFNVTVLEAISAGTLVICSRRAGAAMFIEHGQTGYLFDPQYPEDLSDVIRRVQELSDDERLRIITEARRHTTAFTNPAFVASRHQDVYQRSLFNFSDRNLQSWLYEALIDGSLMRSGKCSNGQPRSLRDVLVACRRWVRAHTQSLH